MLGGFSPDLSFLNEQVPLWFALLMAVTSPHMWSQYVKGICRDLYRSRFGDVPSDDEG